LKDRVLSLINSPFQIYEMVAPLGRVRVVLKESAHPVISPSVIVNGSPAPISSTTPDTTSPWIFRSSLTASTRNWLRSGGLVALAASVCHLPPNLSWAKTATQTKTRIVMAKRDLGFTESLFRRNFQNRAV